MRAPQELSLAVSGHLSVSQSRSLTLNVIYLRASVTLSILGSLTLPARFQDLAREECPAGSRQIFLSHRFLFTATCHQQPLVNRRGGSWRCSVLRYRVLWALSGDGVFIFHPAVHHFHFACGAPADRLCRIGIHPVIGGIIEMRVDL